MPGAFFCGECGSSTRAKLNLTGSSRTDTRELRIDPDAPIAPVRRFADETPTRLPQPVPMSTPAHSEVPSDHGVVSFTLTFANGDSISVSAGGLLGRNPQGGPGEAHEHLIIVTDPDRTVSKTHLEFGIDAGEFWVADRFSGNGTTIFETGKPPRRLVAGRKYRVERGSRIGIGEQLFTLA